MKLYQVCFLSMLLAMMTTTMALAQKTEPKPEASYKPAETTVAVLFAPNFSDDKWKELKEKESKAARDYLVKLFAERGFQTVAADKTDEIVSKAGIDLLKEDQWTKPNFYKIGKDTGANLVAFVMIKQTRQKTVRNILASQYVAEAEIEVWLVDASQEKPLISDESARGRANGGVRGASSRRISAVEFAVKSGYDAFLKPYPPVNAKGKK